MNDVFYAKDFSVFKPTKDGTGGVLSIAYNPKGLLLKIAKQNPGSRTFDWQNATTFMLGMADIASIVDCITSKGKADLFHDSSKAAGAKQGMQKGLSVAYNQQYNSFFWSLRRTQDGQTISAGCPTSIGESMLIRELLLWSLPHLLEWDKIEIAGEGGQAAPRTKEFENEFAGEPDPDLPDVMKNDPFWSQSEVVREPAAQPGTPAHPVDALEKILSLAKTKLGAVSDDDAKMKAMEATNLPLTAQHYPAIIAELERR